MRRSLRGSSGSVLPPVLNDEDTADDEDEDEDGKGAAVADDDNECEDDAALAAARYPGVPVRSES